MVISTKIVHFCYDLWEFCNWTAKRFSALRQIKSVHGTQAGANAYCFGGKQKKQKHFSTQTLSR